MNNLALMPDRPPYVVFEQRAEEDRDATIASGGIVMRDVNYAVVRQPGSKDSIEKQADQWLEDVRRRVMQGKYPQEWLDHFQRQYAAFKEGQTAPEMGLSVKEWPSLSKAQVHNLLAAGVRTVEDAAAMNEPTMQRVGMGAREIKAKAVAYIESREQNKAAEKIAALQADLANRDTTIESLEKRLAALEAAQTQGKRRA